MTCVVQKKKKWIHELQLQCEIINKLMLNLISWLLLYWQRVKYEGKKLCDLINQLSFLVHVLIEWLLESRIVSAGAGLTFRPNDFAFFTFCCFSLINIGLQTPTTSTCSLAPCSPWRLFAGVNWCNDGTAQATTTPFVVH